MATTLVKTACKVGVAGGAVAMTTYLGIWSTDSQTGIQALNSVSDKVFPTKKKITMPSFESTGNQCREMWNKAVKGACSLILTAPEKSTDLVKVVKDKLK